MKTDNNHKFKLYKIIYFLTSFLSFISFIFFVLFIYYFFLTSDDSSILENYKTLAFTFEIILGVILGLIYLSLILTVKIIINENNQRKKKIDAYTIWIYTLMIILTLIPIIPIAPFFHLYFLLYVTDDRLMYKNIVTKKGEPLVEVKDLKLSFKVVGQKQNKLVIRGVSFKLFPNEVLAIIGESGSGKSVLTSTLYGVLVRNAIIHGGSIKILGQDVTNWSESKWKRSGLRGNVVSAVFQNPMTTLNPNQKVGIQIMEGLFVNGIVKTRKKAKETALYYLKKTRIANPEKVFNSYPHQLSGGMKQRVVLSAILACKTKIIILDEPTTALDPTIQAQVLELVKELKREFNLSIIFITHDLGVVASLADRIAIMYAGKIIEQGLTKEVMLHSQHPYTWGLIMSMPDLNVGEELDYIPGNVPLILNNIKGDAFAPRNKYALGIDYIQEPPVFSISKTHTVSSWLLDKKAKRYDPPKGIMERWNRWVTLTSFYEPSKKLKTWAFDHELKQYVKVKDEKQRSYLEAQQSINETPNNLRSSVKKPIDDHLKQKKDNIFKKENFKLYKITNFNQHLDHQEKHTPVILKIRNVSIDYKTNKGDFRAVADVSLNLRKGEILGLVGESGSGKSTLGKALTKQIDHKGEIILNKIILPNKAKRLIRDDIVKQIQMIFQDPTDSLNPFKSVRKNFLEGYNNVTHRKDRKQKISKNEDVLRVLKSIGFDLSVLNMYPLELSGGQQQRISVGRALLVEPKIIVADEPISALDVSIQAQVINMLKDLRQQNDLTILFIAHDLRMVEYISSRIAVMNQGRIVEILPSSEINERAIHPYTKTLLSAVPSINEFDVNLLRMQHDEKEYVITEDTLWWKVGDEHYVFGNQKQVIRWLSSRK